MKRIILLLLAQITLSVFAQETITIKELIFNGMPNFKTKVEQASNDKKISRALLNIVNSRKQPYFKYVLLEKDEKGVTTGSSYILSREEIKSDFDFFKFPIDGFNVIYYDPLLISKKEASEGKKIMAIAKHDGEIIDLSTAIAVPQCDPDGNAPYCIDWYWQTWEGDILVSEEYQYTTCNCIGTGGGGSTGPGPGLSLSPEEQCENIMNDPAGSAMTQNISSITFAVDEFTRNRWWLTKIYDSYLGWFVESNDQGVAEKNPDLPNYWGFKSFGHNAIADKGSCSNTCLVYTVSEDNNFPVWQPGLNKAWLTVGFTVTRQCNIKLSNGQTYNGDIVPLVNSVNIRFSAADQSSSGEVIGGIYTF